MDADAALAGVAGWALSGDLAGIVLQNSTFWTFGWDTLAVLVNLVR